MMTNDELKKKIVEVISQKQTYGIKEEFKTEDLGHRGWQAWTETTKVNNAEIAAALIAAGIGDVKTAQEIGVSATAMAVLEAAEAEHRAERAERALEIAINKVYDYTYEEAIAQAKKELEEEKDNAEV